MTLAIIAWGQLASLQKEFDDMKKSLEESGVLKERADAWEKHCQSV